MAQSLNALLTEVSACTHCTEHLPLGPRPVVQIGPRAKILIIGQAPGTKVHASGKAWDDASGDRLRSWLNLTPDVFYDPALVAHMPMGFCYPGKGKSGDLPPRPECAPLWHDRLLAHLNSVGVTLLIGQYAQARYLGARRRKTLTETVQAWRDYWPSLLPLPHPSPRNVAWFKRNPWFEGEILPDLRERVLSLIAE